MENYPSPVVTKVTGVSYRQLDYWCRTGLVDPITEAHGSGTRREFSFENILRVFILNELLDLFSLTKLRTVLKDFNWQSDDLTYIASGSSLTMAVVDMKTARSSLSEKLKHFTPVTAERPST
jgi:DNA-binding transcriptional MerR regulator